MNCFKRKRIATWIFGPVACLVILAMAGCASTGGTKLRGAGAAARKNTVNAWWYASFNINWPQGESPAWAMDLLIAHRIIKPVLDRYRKDILLWRFHRRAARDEAGHQFSFIFYTTAPAARKIYAAIDSDAVLHQLQAQGVILRVILDDTHNITRRGIEATSDPTWSLPLQKAWPYFIMGVSQTWLDLISQYADKARDKPHSIAEMRAFYRKIDREVETTWKKEGGHAFLHHLDALFGYGPVNVIIRRKIEMQF